MSSNRPRWDTSTRLAAVGVLLTFVGLVVALVALGKPAATPAPVVLPIIVQLPPSTSPTVVGPGAPVG